MFRVLLSASVKMGQTTLLKKKKSVPYTFYIVKFRLSEKNRRLLINL